MAYLFVHFREFTSPNGEQVYFGLSRDGFNWQAANGGQPVLWAYYGDKGVRDHTIVRHEPSGKFYIFATDLSLAYGMRNQYKSSWQMISETGSKNFSVWESQDLLNWSEQRLVKIGTDDLGCLWAPDIIQDKLTGEYFLHWSSPSLIEDTGRKSIYYSRTKDFINFTPPEILYKKSDSGVIDSAMYEEDGFYYLFVKSEGNPANIILLKSESTTGPFARVEAFDSCMQNLEAGKYEAPTAVRLEDGRWCLFLDYYGVRGDGQGYVPFVADSLAKANFTRSDAAFSFPYGFKHGTILTITDEEYKKIAGFNYNIHDYSKY